MRFYEGWQKPFNGSLQRRHYPTLCLVVLLISTIGAGILVLRSSPAQHSVRDGAVSQSVQGQISTHSSDKDQAPYVDQAVMPTGEQQTLERFNPSPKTANRPSSPQSDQTVMSSGVVRAFKTITGQVQDVQNESLVLANVQYADDPRASGGISHVAVPPGRWITRDHWQSDDDSLDMFRGETVVYYVDSHALTPRLRFSRALVRSIDSHVIRADVYYNGGPGLPDEWYDQPKEVSFEFAPYSSLSGRSLSEVTQGEKVIIGWFGDQNNMIVWQMSFVDWKRQ